MSEPRTNSFRFVKPKSEIERYLTRVAGQLVTLANMVSTVEAMESLTQAYQAYPVEQVPASSLSALKDYYTTNLVRIIRS